MISMCWAVLAFSLTADPAPLTVAAGAVDLGSLPAHKPLVHTFKIKNVGSVTVRLRDLAGGCGCFRHQFGTRDLEPGQSTDIVVGIGLLAQPEGAKTWNLGVRYEVAETAGELPLQIAATITRDVAVEPAALMLSAEGEITGSLTVLSRRKPVKVTGVRIGTPGVAAVARAARTVGDGSTQQIDVTVARDLPAGQYADEICIDTNDPDAPEIRVPVRVVKKAAGKGVQAYPGSVSLRFAKDQATATSLLRLKDAGDQQVAVESVTSDHPGVTCKWAAGPERMATVRVTVDRANAPPSGVAVVTVKLSGPAPDAVLIPVSWGGPVAKEPPVDVRTQGSKP